MCSKQVRRKANSVSRIGSVRPGQGILYCYCTMIQQSCVCMDARAWAYALCGMSYMCDTICSYRAGWGGKRDVREKGRAPEQANRTEQNRTEHASRRSDEHALPEEEKNTKKKSVRALPRTVTVTVNHVYSSSLVSFRCLLVVRASADFTKPF
jgi:hypothetical protein